MAFDIGKLKYWRGRKLSKLHRRKIKEGMRRTKRKRSIIMKKAFTEGRLKPFWKDKHLPLSVRLKISETKKEQCRNAAFRSKTSKFFKRLWKEHPEKHKQVMDKTINLWKKDKKLRQKINKKISLAGKRRFSNTAERRKMSIKIREMYRNHPNLIEEQRLRIRIYYELHPEARKRLYDSKGNPFNADIKTLSGYFVRSEGEKKIADFLFSKGIKFFYEAEPIYLLKSPYIPDFWLPDYNCFIEFFGQHPYAQKTKLEKYREYRRNSIPCVFVTPSELVDLNHYLMSELRKVSNSMDAKSFSLKKGQNPFFGIFKISSLRRMQRVFPNLNDEIEELESVIRSRKISQNENQEVD